MSINQVKKKLRQASLLKSLTLDYNFTKNGRTRHVNIIIADQVASYYSWRYRGEGEMYDERNYNYNLTDLHEAKLFANQMHRKSKALDSPKVNNIVLKKRL